MKTKDFFSALFLLTIIFVFAASDIFAQRGGMRAGMEQDAMVQRRTMDMDKCMIPNLTEEQSEAIKNLRTAKLRETTEHRNKMAELRAQKRILMTSENPDMSAINDIIDEMTSLKNAQLKRNAKHRQDIRSLLTEEQRVYFDAKRRGPRELQGARRGAGSGKGMRRW